LVSGSAETVHEAGVSVRGRVVSEKDVPLEELADHIAAIEPAASWKPPKRK
jgi:uncharacterized cysteine cluster protein YcgN (CxxCxxCC family)